MKKIVDIFKERFNEIRKLGYVKSVNDSRSGIGLTFEHLLGKEEDNFPLPDFMNTIEIKTKLSYSKRPIHLFKLTPQGTDLFATKTVVDKYGYYTQSNKNYKSFNGTIFANKLTRIGLNYYFSIKVCYKEGKLSLLVYDKEKKVIDNTIFWYFDELEKALLRKLQFLALVHVWSTTRNGENYYKYYRYDIYRLSNFYNFLYLVDKGIISVTFSIDTYNREGKYGQIHDHGTSFDISKDDIDKLYYKID